MKLYQVKDWNINFENAKSRERDQCSFVCVPNKQHGMSFSRLMAEIDGTMIYGVWGLIIGACSQQRKPRDGWLTSDGYKTGTAWVPEDLAIKFRRPVSEILRSIEVLTSEKVGWILVHEIPCLNDEYPPTTRLVPAECPSGIVKEGKKERMNEGELPRSLSYPNKGKFHIPTLAEIKHEFMKLEIPESEATAFFDNYEAKGWMIGASPMSNLSAACRIWKSNRNKFSKQVGTSVKFRPLPAGEGLNGK